MILHIQVYQEPAFKLLVPIRHEVKLCECSTTDMEPTEYYTNGEKKWRDTNCGKPIPYSHVVEYDKFYGFNGFDEVVDCE